MARRKPTMKETVTVINQVIQEITLIRNDIQTLTGVLNMYMEMEGKEKQFDEFVNKKLNVEVKDDIRKDEKSSTVPVEGSP